MKTICIGDIHGRDTWKGILEKHSDYDRVVFVGDYFDSKEISAVVQLHNFNEICDLKKSDEDQSVILLVGNHDIHYYPGVNSFSTSGYQPHMHWSFLDSINRNVRKLQMAFIDENKYVYSHAGITTAWLKDMGIDQADIYSQVDIINDLLFYKPNKFLFSIDDSSGYGDNVHQTPIWVRPNSLYKRRIPYTQIVGHTVQDKINPAKSRRRGFWLIDTLATSKEFLVIKDGKIEIDRV